MKSNTPRKFLFHVFAINLYIDGCSMYRVTLLSESFRDHLDGWLSGFETKIHTNSWYILSSPCIVDYLFYNLLNVNTRFSML